MVNHLVDTPQSLGHRPGVTGIALDRFEVVRDGISVAIDGMDLLDHAVEQTDLIAPLQQGAGKVASDEAGATSDGNPLAQARVSSIELP